MVTKAVQTLRVYNGAVVGAPPRILWRASIVDCFFWGV